MAGGRGDVLGDLVVTIADVHRAGRLQQQDRGAIGCRGPVLGSLWYDEDRAFLKVDRALLSSACAKRDVDVSVEDEEELVGVGVAVPDELALDLRDADVVVVDLSDDLGAPELVEGVQSVLQADRVCGNDRIVGARDL